MKSRLTRMNVYQFLDNIDAKTISTSAAFICNTTFDNNKIIRVILERLANKRYDTKTIVIVELKKWFGSFIFESKKMFVDCKKNDKTYYMELPRVVRK